MVTGDNEKHVRHWSEVANVRIGFNFSNRNDAKNSSKKWFPYIKGGGFRKWYGNKSFIVNWENDGYLLQNTWHPEEEQTHEVINFNF